MPDIYMDVDAALSEVPVNIMPLLDDTDFKTRETAVAHNAAGMDLVWNFVTTTGAYTQTAVTPTSGGDYDWNHQGDGMYSIEIPASGGASINNDTEGFGWFSGVATGVLPWRGPIIGFRAAAINNSLIDGTDPFAGLNTKLDTIDDFLDTEIAAIKAKTDNLPSDPADDSDIDSQLAALSTKLDTIDDFLDTEIAAILADTNELQTDWVDGGRLDLIIDAVKAKTDNLPSDPADDSDIDSQLASISTKIDTIDDFLDTEIAAIKAKTDNLPSDPADDSDIDSQLAALSTKIDTIDDFLDTEIAAIKAKTDNLPSDPADDSDIDAQLAAILALIDTEVAAILAAVDTEVAAIKTVTDQLVAAHSEPTGAPAANATPLNKLGYLYAALRNAMTVTASAKTFKNDAGSTLWSKALSDDGTTYTEAEGS